MNESAVTNRTEIRMAARFTKVIRLIGGGRIGTGEFGFA